MEESKRKKVTRVGSGAYSVYLPKKWVEAWPSGAGPRTIDLHRINENILIAPVDVPRRHEATVRDDPRRVVWVLTSAYVRGAAKVVLRPRDHFTTQTLVAARDALRNLDDRIVATVEAHQIAYRLDAAPARDAAALLAALASKVEESLRLGEEAVRAHGLDPERSLHALKLIASIHDEETTRLTHQVLRGVATLELQGSTVTDFQLLDLVAEELHAIGARMRDLAMLLFVDLGHRPEDVELPLRHLLASAKSRSVPPFARELMRPSRRGLEDALRLAGAVLGAIHERRLDDLVATHEAAIEARGRLLEAIFAAAVARWGDAQATQEVERLLPAFRIGEPVAQALQSIARMAVLALTLLAAEGE